LNNIVSIDNTYSHKQTIFIEEEIFAGIDVIRTFALDVEKETTTDQSTDETVYIIGCQTTSSLIRRVVWILLRIISNKYYQTKR
jgi:hypothetical protein